MRDHRPDLDPDAPKQRDITEQVHQHHTKHPGSVRRSDKNKARQAAKRAQGIASGQPMSADVDHPIRMALELATAELHDLRTENMRLRHQARETAAIYRRLIATSDDVNSWPFVVEVPRATWDALHAIGGES
jgi:hypothetical protein